jgi:hypothetical protein
VRTATLLYARVVLGLTIKQDGKTFEVTISVKKA